jgi:hypothetical protein
MNVKQTTLVIGITAALAPMAAVHAAAIGTSYLEIANLQFQKEDGTGGWTALLGSDINAANLLNNGDVYSNLNGLGGPTDSGSGQALVSAAGFDIGVTSGGNNGFACVGNCSYTDDSFSYLTKPNDLLVGSYALNDLNLIGSAIDFSNGQDPTWTGATAVGLAESAVNPTNTGTAQGNVGLFGDFTFTAGFTGDLNFRFDYAAYLRAALVNVEGQTADASLGWSLNVRQVGNSSHNFNYDISTDLGLTSISTTTLFDDDFAKNGTVEVSTNNDFFVTGNIYQITIKHLNEANSTAVPSPAPLALIGLGILGMATTLRRRNKIAG